MNGVDAARTPERSVDAPGGFALRIKYADDSGDVPVIPEHALAVMRFGAAELSSDPRLVTIPLDALGATRTIEVWSAAHPVVTGSQQGISFAGSSRLLFGHLRCDETAGCNLEAIAYESYRRLFALARDLGYPHVFRLWNFFADITADENGLERYALFCRGRHRALTQVLEAFEQNLPAASAIGTHVPGLMVCFLAAKSRGAQVENPRQLSAFRYPPRYAPKSPPFSRSICMAWEGVRPQLFISGTASIVGYATRHVGDFAAQATETLDNIDALLEAAGRRTLSSFRLELLRVYARREVLEPELRGLIAARLGPLPLLILRGELCRRDLLVEIEGLAASGQLER